MPRTKLAKPPDPEPDFFDLGLFLDDDLPEPEERVLGLRAPPDDPAVPRLAVLEDGVLVAMSRD